MSDPWYRRWNDRATRQWLVELFALFNLLFLALDVWLAHSFNQFADSIEWLPVTFSATGPLLLIPGLWTNRWHTGAGRRVGYAVGWVAVAIGLAGLFLHLESGFFHRPTLQNLVYSAPFIAPLAYTGIGFLLIVNRLEEGRDWTDWVLLLALAGFVGNFGLSLLDHAQNGFFYWTEYIPVVSGAYACGFLIAALWIDDEGFQRVTLGVMGLQVLVGLLGFVLHFAANVEGVEPTMFGRFVYGAPIFAPLLFPNVALLAAIPLWDRLAEN